MPPTAGLVDFHCHLDQYPDPEAAVREAEAAGIFTLAATTTPQAWPRMRALAQGSRHVQATLGLHPQGLTEADGALELWDRYLPETRLVGEVGLDAGSRFFRSLELQKRVFQHILQGCAQAGNKILTVHSVRSAKAVLDQIATHLPPERGQVVLHWFTGSRYQAERALEWGCYFSINARMLGNERHGPMLQAIPLERLLTETDGPFTQTNGRPSKPADVAGVVAALARTRGLAEAEVAAAIGRTFRTLMAEVPPKKKART